MRQVIKEKSYFKARQLARQACRLGKQGQSLLEYAMVAAIVAAAMVAMSTYVFRSVQSTQQTIHKEFQN